MFGQKCHMSQIQQYGLRSKSLVRQYRSHSRSQVRDTIGHD